MKRKNVSNLYRAELADQEPWDGPDSQSIGQHKDHDFHWNWNQHKDGGSSKHGIEDWTTWQQFLGSNPAKPFSCGLFI